MQLHETYAAVTCIFTNLLKTQHANYKNDSNVHCTSLHHKTFRTEKTLMLNRAAVKN